MVVVGRRGGGGGAKARGKGGGVVGHLCCLEGVKGRPMGEKI